MIPHACDRQPSWAIATDPGIASSPDWRRQAFSTSLLYEPNAGCSAQPHTATVIQSRIDTKAPEESRSTARVTASAPNRALSVYQRVFVTTHWRPHGLSAIGTRALPSTTPSLLPAIFSSLQLQSWGVPIVFRSISSLTFDMRGAWTLRRFGLSVGLRWKSVRRGSTCNPHSSFASLDELRRGVFHAAPSAPAVLLLPLLLE